MVLPTGTRVGRYNGMVGPRCFTQPYDAQEVLLHRIGPLFRHLRRM